MLRVLLYVGLLTALFAGTVFYSGNAIGAWEPPNLPAHAPDASSTDRAKAKKHKNQKDEKRQAPAKRDKS